MTIARLVLFVLSFHIMVLGCKKSSDTPPSNEVWIENMAFNPSTINVTANTTVTWKNKDAVTHTVTSDSASFDSGNLNANGTFTYKFTSAGTYSYHCKIHPTMKGKVVVQTVLVTPMPSGY